MKGRNIHVKGHALVKVDKNDSRKAACSCGAWERSYTFLSPAWRTIWRRTWHDEHKIEVLRAQGKLEDA